MHFLIVASDTAHGRWLALRGLQWPVSITRRNWMGLRYNLISRAVVVDGPFVRASAAERGPGG